MPGPGFDVVPTDCLAGYVASNLERPVSLVIALRGLDSASQSTCAPRFGKFPNLYCAGGKEQLLPSEAGGWCSPWASRESQRAVAVRTITGVSVVDCGDEHKENESEKEPKEAKAERFQEAQAESEARCGEKNNGKK